MQNSAFSSLPREWDDEDWKDQEHHWKQSMRKVKEIVEFIDYLAPQSTHVFNEMLLYRNEICVQLLIASTEIQKQQILIDMLTRLDNERREVESRVREHEIEASYHYRIIQFYLSQEQFLEGKLRFVEYEHSDKPEIRRIKQEFIEKKKTAEEAANAVRKEKADIEAKLADMDAELRESQRLLKSAQSTVEEKCKELKRICKRFNIVDELNPVIESLRLRLYTLTTTEARESASAFINSLNHLADGLMELELS